MNEHEIRRRLLQEIVGMFPLGLASHPQAAEFDDLLKRIETEVGNPILTGVCRGVEALAPADREWAEGVWQRWQDIGSVPA